jgi:hypothetical protein
MKLFKSLLVAPATLGLLAPIAATANEVTINDFNPAEELAITNSRVDGLEARLNNFEAGSFSETTTASFSADMYLGAEDTDEGTDNDSVMAGYSFQIDLNTSFTGEDSLDIAIDAGVAGVGIDEFDGNTNGDSLKVDGLSYTFPLGDKTTVIAGIDTDGSALFTTSCVYGGPGNMLDDCANVNAGITGGGATVGAAYDFGTGLTAAFGAQTTEDAVFTDESLDAYAFNTAYTGDNYGVSVTYGVVETSSTNEDTYTAFNAYYLPEGSNLPSLSVGYEIGDIGGAASTVDEKTSFMFGLSWDEVGPGSAGVAVGHSSTIEGTDEAYQYEAYYSYPINDGMTITPLIYSKDNVTSGADDTTGVMVKTSFSF